MPGKKIFNRLSDQGEAPKRSALAPTCFPEPYDAGGYRGARYCPGKLERLLCLMQPLDTHERSRHGATRISRRVEAPGFSPALEFLHFFACRRHGTKVARDGGVPACLLARRSAGVHGG